MSFRTISAAALILAITAGAASAQDPATIAKARHDHFKQIGGAFKGILDEFKKPAPDVNVLKTNAATIDQLAGQLPTWFPAGTGPEAAPKTHALPTVWQRPAEFKKAAADFASAAHAFNAAAQTGNADAVRAEIQNLGGTCKACHETFRAREEH